MEIPKKPINNNYINLMPKNNGKILIKY